MLGEDGAAVVRAAEPLDQASAFEAVEAVRQAAARQIGARVKAAHEPMLDLRHGPRRPAS